ncbi:hypothetical protein BC629DRAFT_777999 [Irpex lacteus]|nr:hypothetical protein BC629DRAFT_777999 [Irpex lacteus]
MNYRWQHIHYNEHSLFITYIPFTLRQSPVVVRDLSPASRFNVPTWLPSAASRIMDIVKNFASRVILGPLRCRVDCDLLRPPPLVEASLSQHPTQHDTSDITHAHLLPSISHIPRSYRCWAMVHPTFCPFTLTCQGPTPIPLCSHTRLLISRP